MMHRRPVSARHVLDLPLVLCHKEYPRESNAPGLVARGPAAVMTPTSLRTDGLIYP